MSYKAGISLIPQFLAGEKVLYVKKWIWAASGKSLPSYRLFFSLPPIQEAGIYLTDRRILIATYLFRILAFEWSIWFPQRVVSETEEVIQDVTIGRMPVFGKYLQIISEDPIRRWYRSPKSRLRIFLRDPQPLYDLISRAMESSKTD